MFREKPTRVENRPISRKIRGRSAASVRRADVRRANNLKLRSGGLHHVAVEASNFDRSLRFYTEGLGFREVLTFPEENQTVAMLDTGDGTYVELFSDGSGEKPKGSVLHFALRTGDCDAATERARSAGGTVTQEPIDMVLEGDPPVPVRYSFCEGPDRERIELFQADML
jgi:catechol 2,3-dioxygenase-like lactoylglutathione lyase family enzyme